MSDLKILRAAVIGAGAAGLTMARHLAPPAGFDSHSIGSGVRIVPTVFEMADRVGGTWIYNEKTGPKVHSSMYKNLRTNLPKEVMAFPDFPFQQNRQNQSFVTHSEVLRYLEHYCLHFNLEKFVRFRTTVDLVEPIFIDGNEKWQVTSTTTGRNQSLREIYDAVIVCNGHYSDPFIPDIPGLASFEGEVDHSRNYRVNSKFVGKTVAFLGAHASGMDIAIETAETAKQV